MRVPRRGVSAVVLLLALTGGGGEAWRLVAQSRWTVSREPAQTPNLKPTQPPVTSGDRGATYHALESRAVRVTTRFAGVTAVAERALDGRLTTTVTDGAGNEVATLRVDRIDADNDSVAFAIEGVTRQVSRRKGLRASLDWANEQAYSLWKDRSMLEGRTLEWQDTLVRPSGARARRVDTEAIQTDTEWGDGFSATATRKVGTHVSYLTNRQSTGLVYISAFKRNGVELGFSQWWPQEQTLAWSFPGLTEGYVDASRLQQNGGWSFVPDMAWLNTQNLAFQQFHAQVNARQAAARPKGWLERIESFIAPTLSANSPGCDYLHWLDQSIFRPCCDMHDLCYEKREPACGWSSWWLFWSSWQCTQCNARVFFCFATAPGSHVLHRFP